MRIVRGPSVARGKCVLFDGACAQALCGVGFAGKCVMASVGEWDCLGAARMMCAEHAA